MNKLEKISIRTDLRNPNHHLYLNNGSTWWISYTIHRDKQKDRIRHSLHTHTVEVARAKRDAELATYLAGGDFESTEGLDPAIGLAFDSLAGMAVETIMHIASELDEKPATVLMSDALQCLQDISDPVYRQSVAAQFIRELANNLDSVNAA